MLGSRMFSLVFMACFMGAVSCRTASNGSGLRSVQDEHYDEGRGHEDQGAYGGERDKAQAERPCHAYAEQFGIGDFREIRYCTKKNDGSWRCELSGNGGPAGNQDFPDNVYRKCAQQHSQGPIPDHSDPGGY